MCGRGVGGGRELSLLCKYKYLFYVVELGKNEVKAKYGDIFFTFVW